MSRITSSWRFKNTRSHPFRNLGRECGKGKRLNEANLVLLSCEDYLKLDQQGICQRSVGKDLQSKKRKKNGQTYLRLNYKATKMTISFAELFLIAATDLRADMTVPERVIKTMEKTQDQTLNTMKVTM